MAGITVREADGSPTVTNCAELRVSNGTLTEPSSNVAQITVAASDSIADKLYLSENFA